MLSSIPSWDRKACIGVPNPKSLAQPTAIPALLTGKELLSPLPCCGRVRREFAKEMNRLLMEQRAGISNAKRELERVKRESEQVIDAICNGVPGREVKFRMEKLQERKEILEKHIETANEPPPLLHPSMADLYRTKVEQLASRCRRLFAIDLPIHQSGLVRRRRDCDDRPPRDARRMVTPHPGGAVLHRPYTVVTRPRSPAC